MARGRPSRATVYGRLEGAIEELNKRLGGLPSPKEAEFIWAEIWHLEAHHSTALEGNTLVLREVEALLERGRAVGAKPLKEYMEVQGYGAAARWVYGQALEPGDWHDGALISLYEVRQVHQRAMSPVWEVAPHPDATPAEGPGQFREHDIRPFDGGMTPPPWPLVPAAVSEWVDFVNDHADELGSREAPVPWPERLAEVHNEFEKVHPFIDGNGRAGRLLLNLILVRLGYPPVIVLKRQRSSYLNALQRADDGDCGALGEILARAMYDNLNRFIVPNVAGPARLVPLTALANEEFSLAALRQAAQRGRLDAMQGPDGVWRSSRHAVKHYKNTKGRRR
ncbi:Fic family protein [Micromonospora sp. C51]|uniref:Fic family protein n=1 Tax=Micromonospora sp. C51 TaxID=2824879 RepID=UPI001B384F08|nr:Fic family protein [Micromonospora sp. C51]MBQ1048040.1 Fic family protein [Micromonospora sp. C51]